MASNPFLSRRNARRVAAAQIAAHREEINAGVCGGARSLNIAVGLVDALAHAFNQAGGWRATVAERGEAQGTVNIDADVSVPRTDAECPIFSYEEVRRRSAEYVAKAAVEINAALERGERVFRQPIGIADDIVAGLNAPADDGQPSGWRASVHQRHTAHAVIVVAELDEAPVT